MTKVVHITPTYFAPESVIGGGERYPLELARAMSRYVTTEVVSFGDRAQRLQWQDEIPLTVYRRWNTAANNPVNPLFLRKLMNADILHIHQFSTYAANTALLFGKLLGKKVFATDLGGGGRNVGSYIDLSRFLDGYPVISQNHLELSSHIRAPKPIIYAGVDTEFFQPGRQTRERKVIFIGRYNPNKGIDYLIEAMPPDVRLNVIGMPYTDSYYQDLKELAKGRPVHFMTGLTDIQILEEYQTASAVVLPAVLTNRYGGRAPNVQLFALPLVEALACETLPIATNLFAHPEIIEDGVTGFLVPERDPTALRERIQFAVDRPEAAAAMARRGRAVVLGKFTWDHVAKLALQAYGIGTTERSARPIPA